MTYEAWKTQFHLSLDPQQEAAVRRVEGPTLLLAVPGSGKTTVLVTRLGYMTYCLGIDPRRILTVTYTVAAAGDMKRRYLSLFGPQYADALSFRTINGICDTIIRRYAKEEGRSPFQLIADEGEINRVIRQLIQDAGEEYPGDQEVKDVRTQIAYCKNCMLTDQEIRGIKMDGVDFPSLFFSYRSALKRQRQMDFDDQMVFAHRILRRYPRILEYFQLRFPYLCVDEAQDTSKIQHAILQLLAARSQNIFLVGDEDQSIYGFRAAWPQALLEFQSHYPSAQVLLLETNYRSTPAIVERAAQFIQRNRHRKEKQMRAHRPQGAEIGYRTLEDYREQAGYLLQIAQDCRSSTAVLYRNNDSALPLIDLLERKNVPYSCRQRDSLFFSSPTVRDLSDILLFALHPQDRERFLHFYYKLGFKLKRTTLEKILAKAPVDQPVLDVLLASPALPAWQQEKLRALRAQFSKLPQLSSLAALQKVLHGMGYGAYLDSRGGDRNRVHVLMALADQNQKIDGLLLRLEELRELMSRREEQAQAPFVLSTIHSSKGLEYDRVLFIDAVEGILPGTLTPSTPEQAGQLEEDRRLFYVAVTRARERLDLIDCQNRFGEPGPASPFLAQFLSLESSPARRISSDGYPPGTALVHRIFGRGRVQSRTGALGVVDFGKAGVKTLDLAACQRKGLISPCRRWGSD